MPKAVAWANFLVERTDAAEQWPSRPPPDTMTNGH